MALFCKLLGHHKNIICIKNASSITPGCYKTLFSSLSEIVEGFYLAHKSEINATFDNVLGYAFKSLIQKKKAIICKHTLLTIFSQQSDFLHCVLSHHECKHDVVVVGVVFPQAAQYLTSYKLDNYTIKKQGCVFFLLYAFIIGLYKLFRKIAKRLSFKRALCFCRSLAQNKRKVSHEIEYDPRPLYFPHKGIWYGNLMLKDAYYSKNRPPSYYSHCEISPLNSGAHEAYLQHNLEYDLMPRFRLGIVDIINALKVLFVNKKCPLHVRFILTILSLLLAQKGGRFDRFTKNRKGIKIAFIGFDILTDPLLVAMLQESGYYVFAIQERFPPLFFKDFNYMIFDEYLVWLPLAKKVIQENGLSCITFVDILPPYRIDYIYHEHIKKRINTGSRKTKTILCFDYHSEKDQNTIFQPIACVENNKLFYEDVLVLSRVFCDYQFIIKSKDNTWLEMKEYKGVISEIRKRNNISIAGLGRDKLTYQLIAQADIIVGKHTSAMDEARIFGKPIIIHDYGVNFKKAISVAISEVYDERLFAHSQEELVERVRGILSNDCVPLDGYISPYFHKNDDVMQKPRHVTVKERLKTRLDELLSDRSNINHHIYYDDSQLFG